MHRDIKPPNILIKCQPLAAVLGDFGSAKAFLPGLPMTPKMCTLWYEGGVCPGDTPTAHRVAKRAAHAVSLALATAPW